jgi:hypothetical protein
MRHSEHSRGRHDFRFGLIWLRALFLGGLDLGSRRCLGRQGRCTLGRFLPFEDGAHSLHIFAQCATIHILALVRRSRIGWCRHSWCRKKSVCENLMQQRGTTTL